MKYQKIFDMFRNITFEFMGYMKIFKINLIFKFMKLKAFKF